jgi:acetoin utilization protein AcuB
MIARELINQMIPPLEPADTAGIALSWMEEFRCSQLPVVEKGSFVGFISRDQLVAHPADNQILDFKIQNSEGIAGPEDHLYDIVKLSQKFKLPVIAVKDTEGKYMGVIVVSDVLPSILQINTSFAPGSMLVLSLELISYSLSEISRYVEENNAKIISASVTEDPLEKNKIRVAIKINQSDLTRIIATLERFDYRIVARYDDKHVTDPDRERYDLLMRYLNI